MAKEIERKFLLKEEFQESALSVTLAAADGPAEVVKIKQGYLVVDEAEKTVWRVRIKETTDANGNTTKKANWTFKKETGKALSRNEEEGPLPLNQAESLLKSCKRVMTKTRYAIPMQGKTLEWDVFEGHLKGLNVLEVELSSAIDAFHLPEFLVQAVEREVTEELAFRNENLVIKAPLRAESSSRQPRLF
jgi:adenylate cyclase